MDPRERAWLCQVREARRSWRRNPRGVMFDVLGVCRRHQGLGTRRACDEVRQLGRNSPVPSSTEATHASGLTTAVAWRPSAASRGFDRPLSRFRTVSLFTPMASARSTCRQPRSRRYCRNRSANVWQGYRGILRVSAIRRGSSVCVEFWTARAHTRTGNLQTR
jgi:hypothetical protein